MDKPKSHYDILQISPQAEQEVIEAAYKRLARKYHPDINKSPQAAKLMSEINKAYEILKNPITRKLYDKELSKQDYRPIYNISRIDQLRPEEIEEPWLINKWPFLNFKKSDFYSWYLLLILATIIFIIFILLALFSAPGSGVKTTPTTAIKTPTKTTSISTPSPTIKTSSASETERQLIINFSKNLKTLAIEAQEQTKRFNILNDTPGIKPDLTGWDELANDAKNLNKEIENLKNVPSALITSHILLRDWSRHNLQVIEDYITYLKTENDSYRVSANLAIERTNNIWPEFVSNFDEVLRKYEIKPSDLQ